MHHEDPAPLRQAAPGRALAPVLDLGASPHASGPTANDSEPMAAALDALSVSAQRWLAQQDEADQGEGVSHRRLPTARKSEKEQPPLEIPPPIDLKEIP